MTRSNGSSDKPPVQAHAITTLSVAGFKSIVDEQTIEIRPLTLLAGANSSGKSSMMQPLLLLKQTLEAPYDPGPLLLNGPCVKFTSVSQFWPSRFSRLKATEFVVRVGASDETKFAVAFRWDQKAIEIAFNNFTFSGNLIVVSPRSDAGNVIDQYVAHLLAQRFDPDIVHLLERGLKSASPEIGRSRFFLQVAASTSRPDNDSETISVSTGSSPWTEVFGDPGQRILDVVHLPGLRGNPERTYPVSAVGPRFPGTFENYAASLISHWIATSPNVVKGLDDDLTSLGLTWKVEAKRLDDTRVELRVGRMPRRRQGGARDLVSIADVGVGVSQALPVVVALRAARPGQFVYIEQPEIHLHPRAQIAMARLLVNAANRGVRVVVETHSSLILLAVQTLVAEGAIEPSLVGLNWFVRGDRDGTTKIKSAELDEAGRFGDWPEDFDEVALQSENRYLSAAEARLTEK
jgi:AAA domain, putative AbiEii toxin, Type IV TA system